jgi:hypothetical protein
MLSGEHGTLSSAGQVLDKNVNVQKLACIYQTRCGGSYPAIAHI